MYGKPYRGFESLSLRHAVWIAEISYLYSPQNTQNMPVFAIIPRQTGLQRTDYPLVNAVAELAFLWRAHGQSGFTKQSRRM